MKQRSSRGFTLVEMLVVLFLIGVLAAMIAGIYKLITHKGAATRAMGEIHAISMACENYRTEHGSYPVLDDVTQGAMVGNPPNATQSNSPISPLANGDPTVTAYHQSAQYLYGELGGDPNFKGTHGPNDPMPYYAFRADQLAWAPGASAGTAGAVSYVKDPFGNCYGYATAEALNEQIYTQNLQASPSAARLPAQGFNSTFDLWSTGGRVDRVLSNPPPIWPQWIKNW